MLEFLGKTCWESTERSTRKEFTLRPSKNGEPDLEFI